jgi:hypothetical protein
MKRAEAFDAASDRFDAAKRTVDTACEDRARARRERYAARQAHAQASVIADRRRWVSEVPPGGSARCHRQLSQRTPALWVLGTAALACWRPTSIQASISVRSTPRRCTARRSAGTGRRATGARDSREPGLRTQLAGQPTRRPASVRRPWRFPAGGQPPDASWAWSQIRWMRDLKEARRTFPSDQGRKPAGQRRGKGRQC